jgi:polyisoprenoid-binding protein YceI
MKKQVFILAAVALVWVASAFSPSASTVFKVDASKSSLNWLGKKVTGAHNGTVKFSDGNLIVSKNRLTGGSFSMDMTSIDCSDLNGEWKDKLIGHLKSDDFFSSATYPRATLVIKKATALKAEPGKPNYNITADLTIKGKTNPVSFPAVVTISDKSVTADAEFNIDRTKYDVKYGSGSFFTGLGDKMIYDEFTVKVQLTAVK